MLLLPDFHADALLHEVPLQISAPAFPTNQLAVEKPKKKETAAATREYELVDPGSLTRTLSYCAVFVEYAKHPRRTYSSHHTAHNRGPKLRELDLLPPSGSATTWCWGQDVIRPSCMPANATRSSSISQRTAIAPCSCGGSPICFSSTYNEPTPAARCTANKQTVHQYVTDSINDYVLAAHSQA